MARKVIASYVVRLPVGGYQSWMLRRLVGLQRPGHDVWVELMMGVRRLGHDVEWLSCGRTATRLSVGHA